MLFFIFVIITNIIFSQSLELKVKEQITPNSIIPTNSTISITDSTIRISSCRHYYYKILNKYIEDNIIYGTMSECNKLFQDTTNIFKFSIENIDTNNIDFNIIISDEIKIIYKTIKIGDIINAKNKL